MREKAFASPRDVLRTEPAGSEEPPAAHPSPVAERPTAQRRTQANDPRSCCERPG